MDEIKLPHKLILDERRRLELTGAREVRCFEETYAEIGTDRGILTVEGREMKLKCLSLETGTLVIQGEIDGFSYREPSRRRGIFR